MWSSAALRMIDGYRWLGGAVCSIALLSALALADAASAAPMVIVDQEPDVDESLPGGVPGYPVGFRIEFFAPVGQTFIPTISRHVGVELVLSRVCQSLAHLPAIVTLDARREGF